MNAPPLPNYGQWYVIGYADGSKFYVGVVGGSDQWSPEPINAQRFINDTQVLKFLASRKHKHNGQALVPFALETSCYQVQL